MSAFSVADIAASSTVSGTIVNLFQIQSTLSSLSSTTASSTSASVFSSSSNNATVSSSSVPPHPSRKKGRDIVAEPAETARPRAAVSKTPTRSRKKPKRSTKVPLSTRLSEFPEQTLKVDGSQLFCEACGLLELSNVRSTIQGLFVR